MANEDIKALLEAEKQAEVQKAAAAASARQTVLKAEQDGAAAYERTVAAAREKAAGIIAAAETGQRAYAAEQAAKSISERDALKRSASVNMDKAVSAIVSRITAI